LIFVFPFLLMFLLGMVEVSLMLFSRQQLVAASREGARVAALGGDETDVQETVVRYLGPGRLADADVAVTAVDGQPVRSARDIPSGEPVEVWLRLPTAHAVPDLLRFVGFSIREDEIVVRTVMRKE
jgi:hypothetical protein